MQIRRHRWFLSRTALAMFAIVVQTLLPFVVAADIAAAAGAPPICSAPGADHHGKDHRGNNRHDTGGTCPICTALAATATVTTPAPPALPLPRFVLAAIPAAAAQAAPVLHVAPSYRSRAPPIA